MSKLYAVYANGSLMHVVRGGTVVVESEEQANRIKEAFETVAGIKDEQTEYEVVPYVVDPPAKDYDISVNTPRPEDFIAGSREVSPYKERPWHPLPKPHPHTELKSVGLDASHMQQVDVQAALEAMKKLQMNPTEINTVRTSEEWEEIVETAKGKHNPNPAHIPSAESDDREIEETLHEELRKKIERTASTVPTKTVYGIYTVQAEFHRDGKHVTFANYRLAADYIKRVRPFLDFALHSKSKTVPITQKVIGDGLS
jgi:hypothetical protein